MTEPIVLAAWEHERRRPKGTRGGGQWTRSGALGIAEQALAAAPWQFDASTPNAGALAWKERPGRSRLVGRVVGRFAGHVQIDADDGYRHVVKLDTGETVEHIPLDEAGPGIAAVMREASAAEQAAADQRAAARAAADQRITEAAPIPGQLTLPGMQRPEYGANSEPVNRLRNLAPQVHQVIEDYTHPDFQERHGKITWPQQGLQGATAVVELNDGPTVVTKSQDPLRNDREELAYYVSQAIGGGLPAVARDPSGNPRDLIEEYVPGRTVIRYALDEAEKTDDDADTIVQDVMSMSGNNSGDIGLLDFLTANSDRHEANVIVDDRDTAHPIDMGMAIFDGLGTDSPFWPYQDIMGMDYWTEDEVGPIHAELAKIQPEFIRLGHPDWYANMIDTLANLTGKPLPREQFDALALGGRDTYTYDMASDQAGCCQDCRGNITVQLAFNPAEPRGWHGRWISLNAADYEGETGNRDHITRVERGMIPLAAIAHLPGARGERPGRHGARESGGRDWEDFKAAVARGEGGAGSPIFITVDHGQDPVISEGNARRDAYAELGRSHAPVEIRYFGHAERQGTVLDRGM